ncbi:MAG TPA: LamG-like jellyroll fold domain-containing protein, partial [Actinomycetospora sp.]|nr:LamG-like jellyroll fold domain-containing protein [Actinomycetospora sp.]
DTIAPTVSLTAPANGASLAGTVAVTANAADAIGVASVQFRLDGQDLGAADTTAPYSFSWNTLTARDGAHTLTAVARDATGNTRTSTAVAVEVHNTGVVAAYGFDEASGTTATDAIDGHTGTIAGATRSLDGRFGRALSFDGVDDWVSVPHDPTLNLSAAMTLEAWVKPTALTNWRSVITKEQATALPYALYAGSASGTPAASIFTTSALTAAGPPALGLSQWTHLAMTWNGSMLRLYVDGAEIATLAAPGPLLTSNGVLRIGGNSLRGEFFTGLIDEVRIYDRALSPAQLGADLNTPVTP